MAKLPKKIRIGGRDAKISRLPEIRNESGGLCLGRWLGDEYELHLTPHGNLDTERETLVHELTHALFTHFNLHGTPPDEEHIVDCLARGMLMLLNDNPALRSYLFHGR